MRRAAAAEEKSFDDVLQEKAEAGEKWKFADRTFDFSFGLRRGGKEEEEGEVDREGPVDEEAGIEAVEGVSREGSVGECGFETEAVRILLTGGKDGAMKAEEDRK